MELFILIVFVIGYLAIALEHYIHINKAASAVLTGVICWTLYVFFNGDPIFIKHELSEHISDIAGILFFLLGAMTIVELIDSHNGFEAITSLIKTNNKTKLLWIISIITFFLSSALDNLTTAIVMTSLTRKLISDRNEKLLFLGMVIIAANAGGAWSPIGDVTTTMLWIGGQITAGNIIMKLFLPSILCLLVPLILISFRIKGNEPVREITEDGQITTRKERNLVFISGMSALIFVPVFKTVTNLPPYMGMLFGLGVVWIITELLHRHKEQEEKGRFSVVRALERIDTASILFFLGILVAVGALQSTGMLRTMATYLDNTIGNANVIVISLGVLSSIIDNVPLVAAAMGMYDLTTFPPDHYFWEFLAYCCGTGGSMLIIGSAAGVAVMGMEKIDFFWYLKNITFYALAGYFAGAFLYILMEPLFG